MTIKIVFTAILFIGAGLGVWVANSEKYAQRPDVVIGAVSGFLIGGVVDLVLAMIWLGF